MTLNILILSALLSFAGSTSIPSVGTSVLAATNHSRQTVRIGDVPITPNGGMTPPRLVSYIAPAYSDAARTSGVEGTVTVQAEFDIDGNFRVLRVVKGLGFGLDENALVALEDWRFAPAYRSGRRVTVIANIDIAFKLRDDRGRQLLNEAKQRISDVQQRLELEALIRCVRGEQDVRLALLRRCRPG